MKLPKLKYYYYAMTPAAYAAFETSRELMVSPRLSIDIVTGQVSGTTILVMADTGTEIEQHFRRAHPAWSDSVMVLRIPADLVSRNYVKRVHEHLYEYSRSIIIEHCGVERFDPAESL
jgi:hypothetical protein